MTETSGKNQAVRLRHPIVRLVAIHLAAGLISALFSVDRPAFSSGVLLGLTFCQLSLLGMWFGFGRMPFFLRLLILTLGTAYLAVQLGLGIDELSPRTVWVTSIAGILVAGVTWAIRLVRAVVASDRTSPEKEGLQFAIRHLMLLTFVVACLTMLGRLLTPLVADMGPLAAVTALGVCFVAVALASLWAWLGSGAPKYRSIFALLIAAASGLMGAFIHDRTNYLFWTFVMLLQAAFLAVSLAVVRRSGLRLVALRDQNG